MNKLLKNTKDRKIKKEKYRPGEKNSLTDVKGVKVGQFSLQKDIQDKSGRQAFVRTGLTAVLPYPMDREMRLFLGCSRVMSEECTMPSCLTGFLLVEWKSGRPLSLGLTTPT